MVRFLRANKVASQYTPFQEANRTILSGTEHMAPQKLTLV